MGHPIEQACAEVVPISPNDTDLDGAVNDDDATPTNQHPVGTGGAQKTAIGVNAQEFGARASPQVKRLPCLAAFGTPA
jgi:hypothetical protein